MAVTVSVLRKGLIGYKVSGYETFDGKLAMSGADNQEWSGLYVAESRSVARGYRMDVLDESTGSGTAYFHEVHLLEDMKVLVCDDKEFASGAKSGDEKADIARQQIGTQAAVGTALLMPRLGELGFAWKGLHDGSDFEIVIPLKLCSKVVMMKAKTYTYKGFEKKSVAVHIPKS